MIFVYIFIFLRTTKNAGMSYTDFEDVIFKSKGVIYGGYVRDTMIANYYESLFIANNNVDSTLTINRMVKPKDIDVYFNTKDEAEKFIEKLSEYGDVIKKVSYEIQYSGMFREVDHKTIELVKNEMSFLFDISYPFSNMESVMFHIEPPFYNLDMLCNGFIMDINGTRYSECTGTYLDKLEGSERTKEIREITYDIYKFNTHLTSYGMTKANEPYIALRVIKMMKRVFPWVILNAPFQVIKHYIKNDCCNCCGTKLRYNSILFKDRLFETNCFLSNLEYHAKRHDYKIMCGTKHVVKFV